MNSSLVQTDRWEHGSEFHWLDASPAPSDEVPPWASGQLLGSGRDALRTLVHHGRGARGWRRLWIPAYLCQEVVTALTSDGIPLVAYPDLPGRPLVLPSAVAGDAVLAVNTFGLRAGPPPPLPEDVDLVEDHTHDPTSPWARSSRADFAVASLRKTLPVPEGGVLWSPRAHPLPPLPPVTEERRRAAGAKREAMALKARYLAGEAVEKEAFRRLALAGEAEVASGGVSAMTPETAALLATLPLGPWRERRRANHAWLAARLERLQGLRVLRAETEACVPFCIVLVVDDASRRDRLRAALIERRVYPAVLWPLEETVVPVPEEARAFSRRVLCLHCDGRYSSEDLTRVATLLEEAGRA